MSLPPTSHDIMVEGYDRHTLRSIIRDLSGQSWPQDWIIPRIAAAKRALRREEEQDQQATRDDHR